MVPRFQKNPLDVDQALASGEAIGLVEQPILLRVAQRDVLGVVGVRRLT